MRLTVPLCAAATAQRLRTVAAIALCTLANTGHAAVFTVTGSGEPGNPASATCDGSNNCGTLREAVNAALASADAASVIRFSNAIDGQRINLSWCSNASSGSEFGPSSFLISGKSILIDGVTGLAAGITIARGNLTAQGCSEFRLFDVDVGAGLSLVGLTLTNGMAHGGSASYGGGALGAGGAIFNHGSVSIDRCTFVDNVAQGGDSGAAGAGIGGAGVGGDSPSGINSGGPPNGGTISASGGFGGGGSAYDSGASGGFGGGGGQGGSSGGTGGFGAGGGAYGSGSAGVGGFGGGNGGNYTTGHPGGAGAGMGGAIFNDAGTLTVTNSTFTANRATGGSAPGAGAGSAFGGALFNYSGSATVRFATFARNSVSAGLGNGGAADGGSLYHLNDGNCALGGNSCADPSAMLTIEATIAYADSGAANDLVANAINGGFSSWSCNTVLVASQSGIDPTCTIQNDPLLSPLGHYGGTSPTMVPHQGSAAIDGVGYAFGINYDQRGVARPQGGVFSDYGAVEYDGDYLFGNGFD